MIEDFHGNTLDRSFRGIVAAVVEPLFLQYCARTMIRQTLLERLRPVRFLPTLHYEAECLLELIHHPRGNESGDQTRSRTFDNVT
jgi:hypothetical protein